MYLWILLLIIEGSQVEPVGAEIHTAQADDVLVRDELVRAGLRTALAGDVVVRDGFVVAGIRIALAGDVYSGTNLWEQGYTAQAGDVVAAHCELKATRCSAVYCTTRDVNDIHYAWTQFIARLDRGGPHDIKGSHECFLVSTATLYF